MADLMIVLPLHQDEFSDVVLLNLPSKIVDQRLTLFSHRFDFLVQQRQTCEFRLVIFIYTIEKHRPSRFEDEEVFLPSISGMVGNEFSNCSNGP